MEVSCLCYGGSGLGLEYGETPALGADKLKGKGEVRGGQRLGKSLCYGFQGTYLKAWRGLVFESSTHFHIHPFHNYTFQS